MTSRKFKIELKKIHWLESYGDEDNLDLCAHGKVSVSIGSEIVADNTDNPNDWWSLTAMALHLLRTLEMNHTVESLVGDCLVPSEGHHLDHRKNDPLVHVETVYPMGKGKNWWVIHEDGNVKLISESSNETNIPFEDYKNEVLGFVDKVQEFYQTSKPKTLPEDEYDKEGYLKFWKECEMRREKYT